MPKVLLYCQFDTIRICKLSTNDFNNTRSNDSDDYIAMEFAPSASAMISLMTKIALFVSSSDVVQPGWLVKYLRELKAFYLLKSCLAPLGQKTLHGECEMVSSSLFTSGAADNSNVHPVVVVAHTPKAIQFALGLTDGIVYVMIGSLQF
ncbi:hypothetical protein QYE76_029147 [Lolium multiflorum]|uniref:Uncharacterized protein n=1 Tax=Lolium multiflorum TaxID=4521 RepID=A0AAD8QQK7_LOLMU|nr:hypothetical protein QYE76_029147 [Lolium multiflorum]